MHNVFIDGHVGTTGLLIHQRLNKRGDIKLLDISDADRKDSRRKKQVMSDADLVILCLPDDAATESLALAPDARFIDASTAHRTNRAWVYGLPEMHNGHRDVISSAQYVSNPGCWATGFLLPVVPLIEAKLLSTATQLVTNGVSGYSGGGRAMIERYQQQATKQPDKLWHSRPYALSLEHKHLPEMQYYARLEQTPIFQPSVGHYHQGMLLSTALFLDSKTPPEAIHDCLLSRYEDEPCITVHEPNSDSNLDAGFLDPEMNNGTNQLDIFLFGHHSQILLISVLDNLGKGASGAAIQNMNLMLGISELEGLTI